MRLHVKLRKCFVPATLDAYLGAFSQHKATCDAVSYTYIFEGVPGLSCYHESI